MHGRIALSLVAFAAALLAPASPALAHGGPWFGAYEVAVSGGSQNTSWTFNHAPTSPCDAAGSGQGSDDETFLPGGAQPLELSGVGTVAFPTTITGLELHYTEDREGSISYGQPADPNPADCGFLAAGGGGDSSPPTPDCGMRSLSTNVDVNPAPSSPSIAQSPSASAGDQPPYQDCPVYGQVAPAFASPLAAVLPPLGPTLDGGLPSGKATLSATEPITDPDVSGQTALTLDLTFTRLFVVDPLALPAADVTLPVAADGSTTIPIACPAGGACAGTVALELGGFASASSAGPARPAATSAPRFPAPVVQNEPVTGSARFHLKAGHRGVRVRLPGGRLMARSIGSTLFDVVITQGSGRASVRYVAGQAHLRA